MRKLIGLCGQKRSGKDTCADYLVDNYNFTKYSFAYPIKRGVMELFGFTEAQVFGDLKDLVDYDWGVTPRTVLQIMGTEVFQYDIPNYIPELKSIGRGFWVKRFEQWLDINDNIDVVVSDVRFQHEVDSILSLGGSVLKIIRPSLVSVDSHHSEQELNEIKGVGYIINNDNSLSDLHLKLDKIMKEI